jgi:hypothetical protein
VSDRPVDSNGPGLRASSRAARHRPIDAAAADRSIDINQSGEITSRVETHNINETVVTHRLEIDTAKLFGDEQAVNDFIRALERAGLRVT